MPFKNVSDESADYFVRASSSLIYDATGEEMSHGIPFHINRARVSFIAPDLRPPRRAPLFLLFKYLETPVRQFGIIGDGVAKTPGRGDRLI